MLLLALCAAAPGWAALPIDLSSGKWDAEFAALPEDSWAVVEFFASWCTHWHPKIAYVDCVLRYNLPVHHSWSDERFAQAVTS